MPDFMLLMHDDAERAAPPEAWTGYFERLRACGAFQGGSSIGGGETLRQAGEPAAAPLHLVGYIRVEALDLAAAKGLVEGNPVYERGGTVEVREQPSD